MRFDVLSRHRILARLLIAPAMIAGLALATTAVASADPGVGVIGPRPSSNGDGVRCIQQALGVPVDGKYGDQTYGGVKQFQKAHPPLQVDGAVGPETGDALLRDPATSARMTSGCSSHLPSTSSGQPGPVAPVGPQQPANHGKSSIRICHGAICDTYSSHAETVKADAWIQSNDAGTKATCSASKVLGKAVKSVVCAAEKFGLANVRHIVHHAATTNGCMKSSALRGTETGPLYADHSATCHSMD